jgi:hypothetical protein
MPAIFRGFRKIVAAMSCLLSYPSAFPEGHRCPQVISVGRSFKKHPLSPYVHPSLPSLFHQLYLDFYIPVFINVPNIFVIECFSSYKMLQDVTTTSQ